jgi:hypothetical protein
MSDVESELRELRAKRDGVINRAAALLANESSSLDAEIAQAEARWQAAKAAEAAELERANTTALRDAVARFCNHAALLEDALANVVNSPDREWAVLEAIKAVRSLEVAFRPRQTHGRTYKFVDAARTIVQCSNGQSFVWPPNTNISDVSGRIAEQYRLDGSPLKR